MCCILVLFPFLWIIAVKFTNSYFWIFDFLNFQNYPNRLILIQNNHNYHWNFSKTIFYIQNINEITLTHTGLTWKVKNFIFCHFWQLKIHRTHKHLNTCHGLNFHRKLTLLFLMLLTMSSIRINNNWNYQKTPKKCIILLALWILLYLYQEIQMQRLCILVSDFVTFNLLKNGLSIKHFYRLKTTSYEGKCKIMETNDGLCTLIWA